MVPLAGTVFIWQVLFKSRGQNIGGFDFGQLIVYFLIVLLVDKSGDSNGRRVADFRRDP